MNEAQATYVIRSLAGAVWAGRADSLAWAVDFVAAFSTGLPVLVCGQAGSGRSRLADQVSQATGLRLRHLSPRDGRPPTIGEWLTHDEQPPHLNFVSHLEGLRYGTVLTSLIAPLDEYWSHREPDGQWILGAITRYQDLNPQVRFKFGVALTVPPRSTRTRALAMTMRNGAQLPRAIAPGELSELKQFVTRRGSEIRRRRHADMARLVSGMLTKHRQGQPTDLHGYRPWHAIPLVAAAYELIGEESALERATALVCESRIVPA